jgi:hypothetical protein
MNRPGAPAGDHAAERAASSVIPRRSERSGCLAS